MVNEKSSSDLLRQVRRIEIKARGLSKELFAGEYHTAFKGRGMTFSEVREYAVGDDIRRIDWNVTARHNSPFIKVFEEERELTVLLAIDMSNSINWGTQDISKKELISEIAATLAFSAIENNDKVGVLLFTDSVEQYIPPKKGKKHILYIIRTILNFDPKGRKTNIAQPLEFLNKVIKKRSTIFLLSDFNSNENTQALDLQLRLTAKRHDLTAILVQDEREFHLPNIGLIQVEDTETGEFKWIDTSSKKIRLEYSKQFRKEKENLLKKFNSYQIDSTQILTGDNFVQALLKLFAKR